MKIRVVLVNWFRRERKVICHETLRYNDFKNVNPYLVYEAAFLKVTFIAKAVKPA